MPLRDLQTALGALLAAQDPASPREGDVSAALAGAGLTAEERAWLGELVGTPGFRVTCSVRRWWRQTRLRFAARLTLAALGHERFPDLFAAYCEAVPCSSLFFTPEALAFLDFVVRSSPEVPHVGAVARFERALLVAAEAASGPPEEPSADTLPPRQIRRHPAAVVVAFAAPPEDLLAALLADEPLPAPDAARAWPVLVAPGLPYLWRPATPEEANLMQHPAAVEDLIMTRKAPERVVKGLMHAGALCMGY